MWRFAILTGVVLLAAAGFYFWPNRQAVEAETLTVEPRQVSKILTEEGVVQPQDNQVINSPVSGEIAELAIEEGQPVAAGDLLFKLDTRDLAQQKALAEKSLSVQIAQAQAQAPAVELASSQMAQAKEQLDRMQGLADAGAISKAELDAAKYAYADVQTAYEAAQKNQSYLQSLVSSARLQVTQLTSDISRSTVTAPAAGYIKNLMVKEGSFVSPQSEICLLSGEESLLLEALVSTEDVSYLKAGDKVELKIKQGETKLSAAGEIREIMPYAVEKVSSLGLTERRVPVKVAYTDKNLPLAPGYSADVVFTLATAEQALTVPKTAIFAYEDGYAVWKVDQGGLTMLQVVTQDFKTTSDVVIRSGISAGDVVLVNGSQTGIAEGVRIKGF
jgi:HlyD family secretion protein